MPSHIHAKLMMQYAQDAMETEYPSERWEYRVDSEHKWHSLKGDVAFYNNLEYRRKIQTININGYEVPEPLRVAPDIDTTYYLVELINNDINHFYWEGSNVDFKLLSLGLIHLTEEATQLHKDALLSFTKPKE